MTVLTGPTAGGKTALALAWAQRTGGIIVNADASQLYADLRIVSARPTPDEDARAEHRLYGVLDGADMATAARWAELAKAEIARAEAAGRPVALVGGTGMYIGTLIHGIAPVPDIPEAVRAEVRALAPEAAAAALAAEDAVMAARLRPSDRQRIARALEVVRGTGRSLAEWQEARTGGIGTGRVRGFVVDLDRPTLHARAEARLRAMVAEGALAEVGALVARGLDPDLPVMKALGVPEFAAHLAGRLMLDEAIAAAVVATRQYQKRQSTWARGQVGDWPRLDPRDPQAALRLMLQ